MSDDGIETLADELWSTAREAGQCTRRITSDEVADRVRSSVRALAAENGIAVRTARLDDTVVVVRLDASVWNESTATMRAKLAPPD